jgi:omega-6 fatty acid desaturase (delta-12 desaturase)
MRTGKELISASKQFTEENKLRSWSEVLITVVCCGAAFYVAFTNSFPLLVRIAFSIILGLLYIRVFVIYHDFAHRAILRKDKVADIVMNALGMYVLAPKTIWTRSHEHHHNNNSKLTMSGIGSYPTISTERFISLSKGEKTLYLINRHPLTVIFGYFTLFTYWLNLKSFIQSPKKHVDSLLALILHFGVAGTIWYFYGFTAALLTVFLPFFITFGMGAYLFYCQHNFPGARFAENHDWKYDEAALMSTSFMKMSPVMHWFTGNIGYHHVHHLNSRIPFYRLKEAMNSMPELANVQTTSWNPIAVWKCFRLKLWDAEREEMITMSALNHRS